MSIVFSIEKNGVVSQTVPKNSKMTISAKAAETYRIVDTDTGHSPTDIKVKRVGDSLFLESPSNQVLVEVQNFWSECKPGITQCFMMVDAPAVAGGDLVGQSVITQTTGALDSLVAGQVGTLGADAIIAAPVSSVAAASTGGLLGNIVANAGYYALGAGVVGTVIKKEELSSHSIFKNILPPDPVPDTTPLAIVITTKPVASDKTGDALVYGQTKPNLPVTITFPDGTTATTTSDSTGAFGPVPSAKPQASGTITAATVDPAGNKANDTAPFLDVTPPAIVITEPVASNAAGDAVVYGKTEPNLPVTITFPDGTTALTTADATGAFGPVTSTTPQASGKIGAATVDPAGNKATDTAPFIDVTPPAVTIDSITFNPNETSVITGHTEPNTPVTLTLPDGTTLQTTSNAAGVFWSGDNNGY